MAKPLRSKRHAGESGVETVRARERLETVPNSGPQQMIEEIRQLPTLPSVLTQVLQTIQDPEASALDLSRYIAADQVLSAAVLRLVNSAYYGFHRQISSVTTAVVILGFVEIRNLVLAATAFEALGKAGPGGRRSNLWRHSLASAIAAQRCARMMKHPPEGGHFVGGLLHDLGKVVFDVVYPKQYESVAESAAEEGESIRAAELRAFGMDHTEAGAILAEHWDLPNSVVEAIRFHHDPAMAPTERKLCSLTAYANYLAYAAGMGDQGNGREPVFPAEAVLFLDVSPRQQEQLGEDIADIGGPINELLGALSGEA